MENNSRDKQKSVSGRLMVTGKKRFNKRDIPYLYTAITLLVINIIFMIFLLVISKTLPPQVPLYYGFPRGEHQLGTPISLILPLLISSLFIILNSISAYFIKFSFLKKTLILGSFFASLLSFITIIKILLLIINI